MHVSLQAIESLLQSLLESLLDSLLSISPERASHWEVLSIPQGAFGPGKTLSL